MFLFYVILFFIDLIRIESDSALCRQTFGEHKYDLNPFSSLTITGEETIYKYAINPCGLVPTSQCGSSSFPFENGMTACQIRVLGPSPPTFESALGFLDGYGKTPDAQFIENTDGPGTGVIMTMRNAKCNGRERPVKVVFICDESVKTPTNMAVVEFPICEFTIRIKAAGACPVGPNPSGGGGGGGSGSSSGGTVFVIILLVLVVVYLVGGVLYNRLKNNQSGLAMLPHPSFWLLLFSLFIHGCRFTFNFIRTGGKVSSYNSA